MAGNSRTQRHMHFVRLGSMSLLVASIAGCQFDMNPNKPATVGDSGNSQAGAGGSSSTNTGTADTGEGGSGDSGEGGNGEGGQDQGGNDAGGSDATGRGGDTGSSKGGASQGGVSTKSPNIGGQSSTNTAANGGAAQGGSATGGKAQGGSATGGKAQGGSATGGKAQGGSATGGRAQGGSATGGKAQGGSATGGKAQGGTSGSSTESNAVAKEYVDAHNKIRAAVTAPSNYKGTWAPIPDVTWSDEVAASAQQWANHLRDTKNCGLEHEGSGTGLGENLAAGTGLTPAQAVELWAGEKSSFKYTSPFSYTASAGHYTQLVWRDSIQIGCASATCTRMIVISCRYKPPGNMIGGEIF